MVTPNNPRKYVGTNQYLVAFVTRNREPTSADFRQPETGNYYPIGCCWQVGKDPSTGTEGELWFLGKIVANQATWLLYDNTLSEVNSLEGNSGGPVGPTVAGNIFVIGDGSFTFVGTPVNNTLTGQLTGMTNHAILLGAGTTTLTKVLPHATVGTPFCSQGVAADPAYNVSPVTTSITIANMPVLSTDGTNKAYVDLVAAGFSWKNSCTAASTTALTATYANGAAGVGATLTNAGALAAFSVDGVSPSVSDRILIKNQASTFQNGIYVVTTVGSAGVAWVLTRSSDYDTDAEINQGDLVPVQQGTVNANTIWLQTQNVATIGTDPILFQQFQSAPIMTTQYAVLVGAANNGIASVGPSATAGQILQSGGSAANPAYSTATYPSVATGTGTIMRADGTNWVPTTATYPATATGTGKVLTADGTNWVPSTPSFPNASASAGKIIISDGTNWIASTPTYLNATTINRVLYSSANNTVAELPTANSAVLGTDSSGVPSMTQTPSVTSITLSGGSALSTYTTTQSYTPTLAFGGASVGITYTYQAGYYTRIGNMIFFNLTFLLSSKGSSVGTATLALPAATGGGSRQYNVFVCTIHNITLGASYLYAVGSATNGVSTCTISQCRSAGVVQDLADTNFANNSAMTMSGVYSV